MSKTSRTQRPPAVDLRGVAVVLDTNILDQTNLLKDPLTISMLFYLGQLDGTLLLPEVVKREWSEHWAAHMNKRHSNLIDLRGWLAGHVDGVPQFEMDIAHEAERAFTERLLELRDLLVEEPIEAEDWKDAGEMVIAKRAPSKQGSQQYKDSLLWRALLRAAQQQTVILISEDKGFASAEWTGFDETLAEEAREHDADLLLLRTRQELLDLMKAQSSALATNLDGMYISFEEPFIEEVNKLLIELNAGVGESVEWSTGVFATNDPRAVVVSLSMESQLEDLDDPDADMPWYVEASGSALVHVDSWDTEVSLDSAVFKVATPHGDFDRELYRAGAASRRALSKLDGASVAF